MRLMAPNANTASKHGIFVMLDRTRLIDISLTNELEHYDGDDQEQCSQLWPQVGEIAQIGNGKFHLSMILEQKCAIHECAKVTQGHRWLNEVEYWSNDFIQSEGQRTI